MQKTDSSGHIGLDSLPTVITDEIATDVAISMVRGSSARFTLQVGTRSTECMIQIIHAGGGRVSVDFS